MAQHKGRIMNDHGSADALTLLGASRQEYPRSPDECELQTIPWESKTQRASVVRLDCPEFTALCPKTGQPDFGRLTIEYQPRAALIESKALKMYLFSFREHGAFHEVTIDRIAHDLFEALNPYWLRVRGDYLPRGGISIVPTCVLVAADAYPHDVPHA
jgi:7-cyano-7-deazaguanine reductase